MSRKLLAAIATIFGMDDEAWRRHANPWSVYTRFAAIPAMIMAIWSRSWIGWWSLLPIASVLVWLLLNPHIFSPVHEPSNWASKGIFGERLWLREPDSIPGGCRAVLRWLAIPGTTGMILLAWGLLQLSPWPTIFGATLIVLAQLWRIDRLGQFYAGTQRGSVSASDN